MTARSLVSRGSAVCAIGWGAIRKMDAGKVEIGLAPHGSVCLCRFVQARPKDCTPISSCRPNSVRHFASFPSVIFACLTAGPAWEKTTLARKRKRDTPVFSGSDSPGTGSNDLVDLPPRAAGHRIRWSVERVTQLLCRSGPRPLDVSASCSGKRTARERLLDSIMQAIARGEESEALGFAECWSPSAKRRGWSDGRNRSHVTGRRLPDLSSGLLAPRLPFGHRDTFQMA